MMIALLNEPHLVFEHIRRYTNSVTTQFVYGFRTPRIDDPKLLKLYESVEKWSAVTGAGTAALLDVFPILRSLPAAVRPLYSHALSLKKDYFDLALGLWQDAKKGVREGTAKVRFLDFVSNQVPTNKQLANSTHPPAFVLRGPRQCPSGRGTW